ncbi:inositol monophosphatase family protein [Melioribacter sp. OK-6-Me]|uniref:inositol monophosphatase family protein n=1 Tax=unclassified Melioribacter TaxID=2627329 RepID=UPI003ED8639F
MLDKVIEVAKIAGEIIKEGYRKNVSVEYKTNLANLVTEVDKKSEKAIIEFITSNFPGHSILAEESGVKEMDSEYKWIIDPLDGTTNFAHGLPIFSVSIGVQKNNEIICGVVFDIMRDSIYSAEKGSGAFCNNRKLKVSSNDDLRKSLLVTGFPYNIDENPDHAIERFEIFLKNSRAVRRLGSAAIDLCYVAEGIFDGFWEVYLNPWDMAAGKLIIEEAGGVVTNFKNEPLDLNGKQILATNGKIHNKMLSLLNSF